MESESQNESTPVVNRIYALFSETSLWIFLLPVYFYLSAYEYKRGVFSFYNIPSEFVSLDLESLIVTGQQLVWMGIVVTLAIFFNHRFASISVDGVQPKKLFQRIIVCLIFTIPFFYAYGIGKWKEISWYFFILIVSIFGVILEEALVRYSASGKFSLYIRSYGWPQIRIILAMFGVLTFAFLLEPIGEREARDKHIYTVIRSKPEMFVVDYAGQKMICKQFNRDKNTFDKSFVILADAEYSNLKIDVVDLSHHLHYEDADVTQ
jgi:hypothetical protein